MEHRSGNIFIRDNGGVLKAGDVIDQHEHNFDHTGILFTGSVHLKKIRPDGGVMEKDFHAPAHFLIRAEEKHEFTALEPLPPPHVFALARAAQDAAEGLITREQLAAKISKFWLDQNASGSALWCVFSHRYPQGLVDGQEVVDDSGWDGATYEQLNVRREDVIERDVGFSDAYS